ncbi:Alpha/Beta hydrolase protein [Lipomyces japonicus]|uniref:Alpha/Beta hydrolase protein n=1 Tax=Lipomyces japonicus TaxID=56871 RepID=UPI0034CF1076
MSGSENYASRDQIIQQSTLTIEKVSRPFVMRSGSSASRPRLNASTINFHSFPGTAMVLADNQLASNIQNNDSELREWDRRNVQQEPSVTDQNLQQANYRNPTIFENVEYFVRRFISYIFTLSFLSSLMIGAIIIDVSHKANTLAFNLFGKANSNSNRAFAAVELQRASQRTKRDKKVLRDINYYASLVGLQVTQFEVVTEDRFVLEMYRVIDPHETEVQRRTRYPVLLIHGLLQSAGAFCVNEEDSLAFYLCKSGYDVWLANNRCGFFHKHLDYKYNDPRMWDWDVREMATKDLTCFVNFVLEQSGHEKIGVVGHSQGTTQTFLALSKCYVPDLGKKISCFCALAPAVYAGPLVDRKFFKYIRFLSPCAYRLLFGIHAFIPAMISLRNAIPKRWLTYCSCVMFHFLFHWTDSRWDRNLEGRKFQFSPAFVSSKSMSWWLGRNGFAARRCIFEHEDETPWFDQRCPPLALWIASNDLLVDGKRLLRRLEELEPDVPVVKKKVIMEYEHLDVLWAIDAGEQVGKEVNQTLWSTAWNRENFRVPEYCEEL